jgi:multiple sugar transport system ATP-binding protein
MAEVRLPDKLRGKASGDVIAGIRPEDFEDAGLVGDTRDRGNTFKAKIDVLESMGSELYAHFKAETDQKIESDELRELAEDSGAGEVPGGGEDGAIVARLEAASKAQEGSELELWVDATKVKLFDPKDGRNLAVADGAASAD